MFRIVSSKPNLHCCSIDFLELNSYVNSHKWFPTAEKKPHIKKPLNAFMLYMKEMRAQVVAECTLKESAAINQILGRKVRLCSMLF